MIFYTVNSSHLLVAKALPAPVKANAGKHPGTLYVSVDKR
jgi:hypothetical protein